MKIFCSYAEIEHSEPKRVRSIEHPFLFEPPFSFENRTWEKGEEITLGLTIFGDWLEYLPCFIVSFNEMEDFRIGPAKGHLLFKAAYLDNPLQESPMIYDAGTGEFRPECIEPIKFSDICLAEKISKSSKLKITFLSPVRILDNDKPLYLEKLDFLTLLRSIWRRYGELVTFYSKVCNYQSVADEVSIRKLIEEARDIKTVGIKPSSFNKNNEFWYDIERHSERQKREMKLGGFLVEIIFEGDFSDFIPVLIIGQYIHAGKNSIFGFGKYEIST